MTLGSARRYYLGKSKQANERQDEELADVFRDKQSKEPGASLPDDFPHLTALAEQGYTAVEDLTGVSTGELCTAGLTTREASEVLTALSQLT